MVNFMSSNMVPAVAAALLYEFAFTTTSISLGGIALIRLLCQINITVMEEQIGEVAIRVTHALGTLVLSIVESRHLLKERRGLGRRLILLRPPARCGFCTLHGAWPRGECAWLLRVAAAETRRRRCSAGQMWTGHCQHVVARGVVVH